jgi:hypothetical protein
MNKPLPAVALASIFLPAAAQSLRCGANVIGVGEPRSGMPRKCGEPVSRDGGPAR